MSLEILNNKNNSLFDSKILSIDKPSGILENVRGMNLNEISYENKFGLSQKCIETKDDFYSENMDLNKLLNDLSNRTNENFFFFYQKYALVNPNVYLGSSPSTMTPITTTYTPPKYFEYIKGNEKISTTLKVELNKRACFINLKNWGTVVHLDPEKEEIEFRLEFVYTDYLDKRVFNTKTGKYDIDKKYNSIIISTSDTNGFVALSEKLKLGNDAKNDIITLFVEKIKSTENPASLKFLYEKMPDFVIENLLSKLEGKFSNETNITINKKTGKTSSSSSAEKLIWKHLEKLVNDDDRGLFSFTRDSSGALLNLLKVFRKSQFLFESFKNDQALVKRIFENLDSTSIISGKDWSNKTLFANFITALCIDNAFEGLRILNKEFIIGKDYSVSSGSIFQSEKNNEFFLQQLKKTVEKVNVNAHESLNEYTRISLQEADEGNLYHPMDIVYINYADIKESPFPFVSAITIKAFAEERDQQLRADALRIGFDVLAIVLAVAFFPAGGAVGIAAEYIGIGLALADIGITLKREDIMLESGGKEFLEYWEKVYLLGGLALASAAIVEQVFAKSVFCYLEALKNARPLPFLEAYQKSLGKILLEREILTFAGNTLKPSTEISINILAYNSKEIAKATGNIFDSSKNLLPLYEKGAILVKIGENEYALVYKGEKLIQATANDKKLSEFYRKLKKNQKRLAEFLEENRGGNNSQKSIIATDDIEKVQTFKTLENKYAGKTIEKPFEKLSELLPLFNHISVDKEIIQIGFENCADVVDAIINFLKNKKIRKANPSGFESFEKVAAKYGGGYFQQLNPATINGVFETPLERLRALIKNDDIAVIYGVHDLNRITKSTEGHYFIGVKKDGILHLFDGQTGEYLELSSTKTPEFQNFIRSKYRKEFKSTEGGGFRYLIVR
ncbi:hypothetical protein SAMN05443633_102459 [Chryseobacterium arachidis]|uniref:Uncharacterized protein n=2 Tax=Chryseobacterium arachidis TaxID=1416778 RepID=A0A1M4XY49_9FLAO|nr:hypothetical protein SAMN05443633_102459 [Chryseobacterium arachidis]